MKRFFGQLFRIFFYFIIFQQNLSAESLASKCALITVTLMRNITGHTSYVYSLASLPNGYLATGDDIGEIKIWNTTTGSLIRNISGYSYGVSFFKTIFKIQSISRWFSTTTSRIVEIKKNDLVQSTTSQLHIIQS